MFNPWHDVSMGDNAPEVVNGIVEIPRGSRAKYVTRIRCAHATHARKQNLFLRKKSFEAYTCMCIRMRLVSQC